MFVVEGEKDADRLWSMGLVATTNAGGAKRWQDGFAACLCGRKVVVIPDNDAPGRAHAYKVAKSLDGAAAAVRVVELPGVPPKGDVSDYLDAGGTPEQLLALVEAAPVWKATNYVEEALSGSSGPCDAGGDELGILSKGEYEADKPGDEVIYDPKNPLPIARDLRCAHYTHPAGPTLYFGDSVFAWWSGARYENVEPAGVRAHFYEFLEPCKKWVRSGDNLILVDFAPNRASVDNAVDALKAVSYTAARPPCWLDEDADRPDPRELLVARNGIVHLRPDGNPAFLCPPTPRLFTYIALDYDYDPNPPPPTEWLKFLKTVWPDDPTSVRLIQMWLGYCLTCDTRQHKILLLVGPPRSGKGTIARILSAMIGEANVCGPTLSGLSTNFGMQELLGKTLAIISDARLSARTDIATVTERLLAVSGEDGVTIDRKNLPPITTRLLIKFAILTNELPRFNDPSGAIAGRLVLATMTESFLGKEDLDLERRLLLEMPSILGWAVEGWRDLRRTGHFVQPTQSKQTIEEMKDLASPISAFLREWCEKLPAGEVAMHDLYEMWCVWCESQGDSRPGTAPHFGRDLRAAVPHLGTAQVSVNDERVRVYRGVKLTAERAAELARIRATRSEKEKERWARRQG